MTDKEIIKALECCAGKDVLCKDCAYLNNPPYPACRSLAATQALDLIKRQEKEIERLREECGEQSVLWRDHFESIFESAKETIRAEAIKEFAERLKGDEFEIQTDRNNTGYLLSGKEIDDLVKEMVGNSDERK